MRRESKKEKPEKVKKIKPKEAKLSKGSKKKLKFGIRNKIVICFLVPIAFVIIVGLAAYQKAEKGLSQNYEDSAKQTLRMVTEYIDISCKFIESEGLKYAYDDQLNQ